MSKSISTVWDSLKQWFDTESTLVQQEEFEQAIDSRRPRRVEWVRLMPFLLLHLGCLAVLSTGASTFAVLFAVGFYALRMFAITAFYHRYFSHKSFRTHRVWQFVFALLGCMAVQRGPLWWAAQHRHHHQYSDQPADRHSPHHQGFLWAHWGWFTSDEGFRTDYSKIRDFARFPELRFLNRFDTLVPFLTALAIFALGEWLEQAAPQLGCDGWQLLVWGFCISTVCLFHATASINSLGHLWGKQRFATHDDSRNNGVLALLTFGEGWHNNHHRWPVSARQGFLWWELDLTYYLLRLLAWVGIVRDLQPVPAAVLREAESAGTDCSKTSLPPASTHLDS